jgi:hypothetical protein
MKLTFKHFHECFEALEIFDAEEPDATPLGEFLIVKGVRSFSNWTIAPLRSINILTGPNSSGKSTLLEIISSLGTKTFEKKLRQLAEASSKPTFIGFSIDFGALGKKRHNPDWFRSSVSYDFLREVAEKFNSNSKKEFNGKRITLLAESKGEDWPLDIYIFVDKRCVAFSRVEQDPSDISSKLYLKILDEFWKMQFSDEFATELISQLSCLPYLTKSKIKLNKDLVRKDLDDCQWILLDFSESRLPFLNDGPSIQFDRYLSDPEEAAYALICIYIAFAKPFQVMERFGGETMPGIRPISTAAELTFNFQAGKLGDQIISNMEQTSTGTAVAFQEIAETLARNEIGLNSYRNGKNQVSEINKWLARILNGSHRLAYRSRSQAVTEKKHPWSMHKQWRGMHYVLYEVEFFLLDKSKRELALSDVGTGVSQLLPVISSLIGGNNNLYSQPELHLHPKAQAVLGDLFIFGLQRNKEINKKHPGVLVHGVTLETHSEHLILRILRRVKEKTGTADSPTISNRDISLVYVNPEGDGSALHWIRIDRDGEFIDVWPNGFFVDRFEDIFFSIDE